jgi:hypothetical protein
VNSGIESRGPRVVSHLQEELRIGREKERQNRGGRAGCTPVTGGISGMLWICEKGGDRWIVLAGAKFEVCVFGIPTAERRIMLRNGLIRVSSRGTRRIRVQMILEISSFLKPWLENPGCQNHAR